MSKRADLRFIRIGQAIKRARVRACLSQAELAARCELTHADISRIENGRSNPTVKMLIRVLEALHIERFEL